MKLCTPMLSRVAPRSERTAMRSAVAVAGEVSTDHGTALRSAPITFSQMSQSWTSSSAVRYVGVPPPNAARVNPGAPLASRASRVTRACRSRVPRKLRVTSSGAPVRVKRLQKPQRISQNGMWTYRESESSRSPAHRSERRGLFSPSRYAF